MKSIVAFCLQLRWAVLLASIALMVGGFVVISEMHVDAFPEFAPPLVEVQTEAPGLSSIQVEQLVTIPLEAALNGTPRMKTLRSKSVLGLSSIVMLFPDGTNVNDARQFVQERLGRAASQLPQIVKPPVMLPPLSATSRVMKIGVTSETLSQLELSDIVRFTVRPALLAVPGVANIAIWGERNRQVNVEIDPYQLRAFGLSADDVTAALAIALQASPGGFVETPTQRLAVVHAPAATDSKSIGDMIIKVQGRAALRLRDVAKIDEGFPPLIGDAVVNGGLGLLLIVEKQPWGNTLDVTRRVEAAIAALAPATKNVSFDPAIFRPATFVERSIKNLGQALVLGCVLVMLVLAGFLYDWRTALISITAIPLSLVSACLVMDAMGLTLDTMAIAGLAIALGEVVDDAIIDVENILRRLRQHPARPALQIVLDASLEVRSAVVYASLIVILVFLPVFFLDGLAGSFFRPLARSYVLAVGASLGVALTVTPALSLLLLRKRSIEATRAPLAARLKRFVEPLLAKVLDRPRAAGTVVGASFGVALLIVPFLGEAFLPAFKETDFLMHWVAKPGASLEAVTRTTLRASKELLDVPGIRHFGAHIGRAEAADEVVGANFAELWISLDEGADYNASVAQVQAIVDRYPGITRDVQTYLQERVKEVLTGASGSIVVRIFGPDLGLLREKGAEITALLAKVEGVSNLKIEPQVLIPQIDVRLKERGAAEHGLLPGELQRMTTTLLQGTKVGQIYRDEQRIDVVVRGEPELREDVTSLASMPIWTKSGTALRLRDVADIAVNPAPNIIQREGASRRLDVTCDAKGRDLGAVAKDVAAAVRSVAFGPGHHAEILGEAAARSAARTKLWGLTLLALFGIAVILHADFRSLQLAGLVFMTLPFALVGGVFAVLLTGGVVTLGAVVGFVTVIGIAARNGIMLVSHYRHLEHEERVPFDRALVLRGTLERVVPITMTALATGLALVPLILGGDKPGYEIEHPMAVVILGGLVSSTLMNVFLLPSLYLRLRQRNFERGTLIDG